MPDLPCDTELKMVREEFLFGTLQRALEVNGGIQTRAAAVFYARALFGDERIIWARPTGRGWRCYTASDEPQAMYRGELVRIVRVNRKSVTIELRSKDTHRRVKPMELR